MTKAMPFETVAEFYDAVYSDRNVKKDLVEVSSLFPTGARLLDVGCGTGFHSTYLQNLGYKVIGLEPSYSMAKIAKKKGLRNIIRTPIQDLSIEGVRNHFDAVLCMFDVLDYVRSEQDFQRSVANIRSVVANGGYVFIESWNKDTMPYKYEARRIKNFLYQGKNAVRTSIVKFHNGQFNVKFTYNIGNNSYFEEHILYPRFGFDNSFLTKCGFTIEKQEQDDYSVKLILRAY